MYNSYDKGKQSCKNENVHQTIKDKKYTNYYKNYGRYHIHYPDGIQMWRVIFIHIGLLMYFIYIYLIEGLFDIYGLSPVHIFHIFMSHKTFSYSNNFLIFNYGNYIPFPYIFR